MRLRYPGLTVESLPSGNRRYRVRVEGQSNKKIVLPFGPEHQDFHQAYRAARVGVVTSLLTGDAPSEGSLEWLVTGYLKHLEKQVQRGKASPYTLKQRRNQLRRLLREENETGRKAGQLYAGLPMLIPQKELIALRDRHADTPGETHNLFKSLRAMYEWGIEAQHVTTNPAKGIKSSYEGGGGAEAWTLDDLAQYRKRHPLGTMAHLALSLLTFTACRIGDAHRLGRGNEVKRDGVLWLDWQPGKRGSKKVSIPILPPLLAAMKAQTATGDTYLLTEAGQPFSSPEALRRRFSKWCGQAGIEGRSAHGIRKAAGHLLALNGATQYEIMAVHGHANAATSEVYTKDVDRIRLGALAASRLSGMEW